LAEWEHGYHDTNFTGNYWCLLFCGVVLDSTITYLASTGDLQLLLALLCPVLLTHEGGAAIAPVVYFLTFYLDDLKHDDHQLCFSDFMRMGYGKLHFADCSRYFLFCSKKGQTYHPASALTFDA
jgi:hypothetical protein